MMLSRQLIGAVLVCCCVAVTCSGLVDGETQDDEHLLKKYLTERGQSVSRGRYNTYNARPRVKRGWGFDDFFEDVGDAVDDVADAVDDVADAVDDAVDNVADAVDDVVDAVDDVVDDVVDAVDDVVDDVADVVDDVVDAAGDIIDDAKDALDDIVDDVKDGVDNLLDDVEDFFDDAVDFTEDLFSDIVESAQHLVDDVIEAVHDGIDFLIDITCFGVHVASKVLEYTAIENQIEIFSDIRQKSANILYELTCSARNLKGVRTPATKPSIQCPKSQVVYAEEGETGATISWENATASTGATVSRYFREGDTKVYSGDSVQIGRYVVIYVAVDQRTGASSACAFTVRVIGKKCDVERPANSHVTCDYLRRHNTTHYTTWGHTCDLTCQGANQILTFRCLEDGNFTVEGRQTPRITCEDDTATPGEWSEWTQCSVSCDMGVQRRYKTCTGQDSLCSGGVRTETKFCSNKPCPKCPKPPSAPDMGKASLIPSGTDVVLSYSCYKWSVPTGKFPASRCGETTGHRWMPEINGQDFPVCLRTKMASAVEFTNEIAFTSTTDLQQIIMASSKTHPRTKTEEVHAGSKCAATSQCALSMYLEYADGQTEDYPLAGTGRRKRSADSLAFKHRFTVSQNFHHRDYLGVGDMGDEIATAEISQLVEFYLDTEDIKNKTAHSVEAGAWDFLELGVQFSAIRDSYSTQMRLDCPLGTVPDIVYCVECPPGTHYVEQSCEACPLGQYQSLKGALSCDLCPGNLTTVHPGAKSAGECVSPQIQENSNFQSEQQEQIMVDDSNEGIRQEVLIGAIVGGAVLALIVAVLFVVFMLKRNKNNKPATEKAFKSPIPAISGMKAIDNEYSDPESPAKR